MWASCNEMVFQIFTTRDSFKLKLNELKVKSLSFNSLKEYLGLIEALFKAPSLAVDRINIVSVLTVEFQTLCFM